MTSTKAANFGYLCTILVGIIAVANREYTFLKDTLDYKPY